MTLLRETLRLVLYTIAAIRLKLDVVRYRARRAILRLMRRVLDWMEPVG